MCVAQGTELLRGGEAAPVIYLLAEGQCVLQCSYLGLDSGGARAHDILDISHLRVSVIATGTHQRDQWRFCPFVSFLFSLFYSQAL